MLDGNTGFDEGVIGPDREEPNDLRAEDSVGTVNETEMPRYQSHKIVWALKIKSIVTDLELARGQNRETDGSSIITPEDEQFTEFKVDHEYVHKHNPQVGGYYVVYEDGYKSWSPAEAFESGYTRI